MSRTTSPQGHSSRRSRQGTRITVSARTAEKQQRAAQAAAQPATWRSRLRRFGLASVIAHAVILAVACALAFTVLLLSNQPLGMLPAAVAYTWLAGHTVAIGDGEVTVSAFPLLGAMGVIAGVAAMIRYTVKKRVSVTDLAVMVPMFLVVPILIALGMWAVLRDADFHASLPAALGTVAAVDAIAIVLGMGSALWRALGRKYGVPTEVVYGFGVASRFLGWLALAAAIALVISLVWHHESIMHLRAALGEGSEFIGLMGVSVIYVVNAVVAAMAVLVGAEVSFGPAVASVFTAELAPMPAIPLLAAWPESVWSAAWVLLLIPLGLGVACARRISSLPGKSWLTGISAVAWSAVLAGILSWLIRGEVGIYGRLQLWSLGFILLNAAWMAVGVVAIHLAEMILTRRAIAAVPEAFRDAAESGNEDSDGDGEPTAEGNDPEGNPAIDPEPPENPDLPVDEDPAVDGDSEAEPDPNADDPEAEPDPNADEAAWMGENQAGADAQEDNPGEEEEWTRTDSNSAAPENQTGVEDEEKPTDIDEDGGAEEQPR